MSSLILGADNGLIPETSFLYFGGSQGTLVEGFSVTVSGVSAIPEPSTYATFAGLLAGCVAFYVRRRRRLSAA